ncbi:Hsp20/alpha crystallin family protein [Streptomyces sp. XH2]|uniref:Hsp20/alpha crystallin family protein n=1 Tax=Streptomyces sp. XH2 TaxID=3412483 RepID=UPI003C7A2A15
MAGALSPRHRSLFPDLREWMEGGFPGFPAAWTTSGAHPIPVEITRENGQYVLKAEMPGLDPEDIEITVEGETLTVKAEHTERQEDKQHSEFRYGSFERSVRLPAPIPEEGVTAEYRDGILTVRVPQPEKPAPGARTVAVRRAD